MTSEKLTVFIRPRLYQTCLTGLSCLATLTALALINPPQTYVLADASAPARVDSGQGQAVKDVTRTIVVVDQAGQELHRTVQSPHQLASGQSVWPDFFTPAVAGYVPTSKDDLQVASQTVGPQTKDETVKLTFTKANGQPDTDSKVGVQFEWRMIDDHGQEIHQADEMVMAKPGTEVSTPEPLRNSRFVADVPKAVHVYPGGPQTYQLTVEPVGVGHPEVRAVTRSITMEMPDGSQKIHHDVLRFSRQYELNTTNQVLQLTSWHPETTDMWPQFTPPKVPGYTTGYDVIGQRRFPTFFLDHPERLKETNIALKYRSVPSTKQERTLTRTIVLHSPGEKDSRVVQTVKASRMVYEDPFDGQEFGPWSYQGEFQAYPVPVRSGYHATLKEVPALNPATFPERADAITVAVAYQPLTTQTTEQKTISRRVVWRVPGRPDKVAVQEVGAVRTVYHHQPGDQPSASPWHFLSDFPSLPAPQVAGFVPDHPAAPSLKPTAAMVEAGVPDLVVSYQADRDGVVLDSPGIAGTKDNGQHKAASSGLNDAVKRPTKQAESTNQPASTNSASQVVSHAVNTDSVSQAGSHATSPITVNHAASRVTSASPVSHLTSQTVSAAPANDPTIPVTKTDLASLASSQVVSASPISPATNQAASKVTASPRTSQASSAVTSNHLLSPAVSQTPAASLAGHPASQGDLVHSSAASYHSAAKPTSNPVTPTVSASQAAWHEDPVRPGKAAAVTSPAAPVGESTTPLAQKTVADPAKAKVNQPQSVDANPAPIQTDDDGQPLASGTATHPNTVADPGKVVALPWWRHATQSDEAKSGLATKKPVTEASNVVEMTKARTTKTSPLPAAPSQTKVIPADASGTGQTSQLGGQEAIKSAAPFNPADEVPITTDELPPYFGQGDEESNDDQHPTRESADHSHSSVRSDENNQTLPQTGNTDNRTTFLALITTVLTGIFGLLSFKGKRR